MTDIAPPATAGTMVVNCVAYDSKTGRRLAVIALDEISDYLEKPDTFVWVGMHEPSEDFLDKMQEEFDLHPLAVEDAQHAHQRPKIELYGDSLFIVVHTVQELDCRIQFGETHIFLGPRYLLSIRHGASMSYAAARARCEREPELLALGPSYCLYAILDFAVDNYQPIVDSFHKELASLEEAIFSDEFKRDTIERLYELKKELMTLRFAISPMQDILSPLIRLHPTLVRDEVRPYFRDIRDHAVRATEAISAMSEVVSSAMNVNLSMVTVAQGDVVKRLAAWAALIAAPTLIASWYGMNFRHMPELSGPYSYYALIGVTALICVVLYRVLKRTKWL